MLSPQCASDGASPSANSIEIGVRGPEKTDRPWRLVAGTLSDIELRVASMSVDRVTATRIDRMNRECAGEESTAVIKRRHPPTVKILGGQLFAAPQLLRAFELSVTGVQALAELAKS